MYMWNSKAFTSSMIHFNSIRINHKSNDTNGSVIQIIDDFQLRWIKGNRAPISDSGNGSKAKDRIEIA